MNRYGVKTATLTFGSTSYEMASGPAGKSETKEAIEVTALTDTVKQFITGALKETDEFTVTLYQKGGSDDLTVDTAPAQLTLAVTLDNGTANASATATIAKAIVTKVAYPNVEGSGDRKATYDVTFRPDGSTSGNSAT